MEARKEADFPLFHVSWWMLDVRLMSAWNVESCYVDPADSAASNSSDRLHCIRSKRFSNADIIQTTGTIQRHHNRLKNHILILVDFSNRQIQSIEKFSIGNSILDIVIAVLYEPVRSVMVPCRLMCTMDQQTKEIPMQRLPFGCTHRLCLEKMMVIFHFVWMFVLRHVDLSNNNGPERTSTIFHRDDSGIVTRIHVDNYLLCRHMIVGLLRIFWLIIGD